MEAAMHLFIFVANLLLIYILFVCFMTLLFLAYNWRTIVSTQSIGSSSKYIFTNSNVTALSYVFGVLHQQMYLENMLSNV